MRTSTSSPSPIDPRQRQTETRSDHSKARTRPSPDVVSRTTLATSLGVDEVRRCSSRAGMAGGTEACFPSAQPGNRMGRLTVRNAGYTEPVEGRQLRFVAPRRVEIERVEVRPPAPGEVL